MSNEIRADYQSQMLLPPSLEDWIPADHPARFIRDFVDSLDMAALGFKQRESKEGRPNYSSDLLLKVWLYAYFDRICSTRSLERACREHISLIWLTGMNYPDHNTLWRFLRDNGKPIRKVFAQGVRVAAKNDLVGMVVHAVDGTKIRAQASKWTAHHRKALEEALKGLESKIDKMLSEAEASEELEIGDYRLSKELEDAEQRKDRIRKALSELEDAGTDHLQPAEPDARMMKCEGTYDFAYNAQGVVDQKNGLIVAQDVTNDRTDQNQLPGMLKQVEEVLTTTAEETLADAGYASGESLKKAQEMNAEVLVVLPPKMNPQQGEGEYHASRFQYDADADVCICPQGQTLIFERERWDRSHRYRERVYRCKHHRECPRRPECTKDPKGRMIAISSRREAVQRQIEKQEDPAKRALMEKRKTIVEPVFGHIKEAMMFRRWLLRYLDGVKTQWSLVCLAANLRKLYRHWAAGTLKLA
jgi:transposase